MLSRQREARGGPDWPRCILSRPLPRESPEETALTTDDASSLAPPTAIGPYRVLHQVGAGVLGPVYRAHSADDGREVAVKLFKLDLTPEQASDLATSLARLCQRVPAHPHIPKYLAAGLAGSSAWLAEEYVPADALDARLRRRTGGGLRQSLPLLRQVAAAMDAAAEAGLHHGALHPRDILISTTGDVRVTGFGVADAVAAAGGAPPIRRPYTAPERTGTTQRPADAAADVFSLGTIAVEMLTGRRPIGTGATAVGFVSGVSEGIDADACRRALGRALADGPRERFATATAFVAALARAAEVPARERAPADAPAGQAAPDSAVAPVSSVAAPHSVPRAPIDQPAPPPAPDARPGPSGEAPATVPARAREAPPPGPAGGTSAPPDARGTASTRATESVPRSRGKAVAPDVTGDRAARSPQTPVPSRPSAEAKEPRASEATAPAAIPASSHGAAESQPPPVVGSAAGATPAPPAAGPLAEHATAERGVPADRAPTKPAPGKVVVSETVASPAAVPGVARPPIEIDVPGIAAAPLVDITPSSLEFDFPVSEAAVSDAAAPPAAATRRQGPIRFEHVPAPRRDVRPAPAPGPAEIGGGDRAVRPTTAWVPGRSAAALLLVGLALGLAFGYLLWGRRPAGLATEARQSPADIAVPAGASAALGKAPAAAAPTEVPLAPPPAAPPAATPRAEPRPAAPAVRGRLLVGSRPAGARVILGGRARGETPLTIENLPLGAHELTVSHEGYQPATRRVTLTEASPSRRLVVSLSRRAEAPRAPAAAAPSAAKASAAEPTTVEVLSRPAGARVYIDGRPVGTTPFTSAPLAPGPHLVHLELAGHRPWSSPVTLEGGKRTRVTASLELVP